MSVVSLSWDDIAGSDFRRGAPPSSKCPQLPDHSGGRVWSRKDQGT